MVQDMMAVFLDATQGSEEFNHSIVYYIVYTVLFEYLPFLTTKIVFVFKKTPN